MSVSSIIGGGIRLVRTQPRVVAIWTALHFAVVATGMVMLRPIILSMFEMQQRAMAESAAGAMKPPALHPEIFGAILAIDVLLCIMLTILFAAVVRAVAQPTGDRFAYLRFGMDEFRLIGLGVVFIVAAILAEIVAILALVLIGALLSVVIGKAGGIVVASVTGILFFLAAIYAEVRLSLAGVYTVLQGRIVIKDAWHATKGQFWRLFGVFFILSLAYVLVMIVIVAVTNPQILTAYASMDLRALNAVAQEQLARQGSGSSAGLIVQMLVGAIIGVPALVISFGAIATAALEMGAPVEG